MKVAVRLSTISDAEINFIKQMGINNINLGASILAPKKGVLYGFQNVRFDKQQVTKILLKINNANLNISSFHALPIRLALLGHTEGEKQIKDLCKFISLLGEQSVELTQIGLETLRHGPIGVPGRYIRNAIYRKNVFSLKRMKKELLKKEMNSVYTHHIIEKIKPKEYFSNCINILNKIITVAEDSDVKIGIHTDDPPVPDNEGLLPGITNTLMINRLFEAVPSKNLGLIFCCGTMYEAGADIYDQIRLFGGRKKIFYVHFRNVRGTIPSAGKYEEVAIDDGDIDMYKVLKALKDVNYDGVVEPDHFPTFSGDENNRAGLAYTVGFIKCLLSKLRMQSD